MLSYQEQDYLCTKRIKLGHAEMDQLHRTLAYWVAEEFACPMPLNIYFELCELSRRPRLQVVFERKATTIAFYDAIGNYDSMRQDAVAAHFFDLLKASGDTQTDTEGMFVIFTSFEPVAREEANSHIDDRRLAAIKQEIGDPNIWTIAPLFDTVTFFFHTDAQLEMSENQPVRSRCLDAYTTVLRQFDEFGYFAETPISHKFDSRQNFEENHGGSWQAYFR